MTPDDAVAAHVSARGLVSPTHLQQARARLAALRQAGTPADLAGVLGAILPPETVAELRAMAGGAFQRETRRRAQRSTLPEAGDLVGPYRVAHELGRGGMGVVYEAEHVELGRRVALKLRLTRAGQDAAADQRFLLEAQAAARLEHPGVVRVHETGRDDDGRLWIAMDFVEGQPLDRLVERGGRLPVERAAVVALGIARALAHAHEQGVLHRDLKPANVLLRADGAPLVMDFGLAKLVEGGDALTRTGELLGTPSYMPPEQANGERVDARADVWSLGATLYYLLVGAPPFTGDSVVSVLQAVLRAAVPSPRERRPEVPAALEAIVARCMARERDERYATAAEVADDLTRFIGQGQTDAGARVQTRRRRLAALGALATAGALSLGGLGPWLWPDEAPPDDPPPPPTVTETAPRPVDDPVVPPPVAQGPRWVLREVEERPPARWSHAMAWDARRKVVVVFGGYDGRRSFDDLWSWDGEVWREERTDPRPPPRYGHALAYDGAREVLVLHGGATSGRRGPTRADLWEFDGERWERRLDNSLLELRAFHGAAYDPRRRRTVFYGGLAIDLQPRSDLWTWDGEFLQPLDPGPAPPPGARGRAGVGWDAARDLLVVVGAGAAAGSEEHWVWQAERGWHQLEPLRMGPRHQPSLVGGGDELLLLCGARPFGDDAWRWRDTRWDRVKTENAPPPARRWQAAAWDPERRVAVLFGGHGARGGLDDTWELRLE